MLSHTFEEYLSLEEEAEYKSEYRDGSIVPMSRNTTKHNEILGNLAVDLKQNLRKQNYHLYMVGVRLWIPRYRFCTYPDLMLIEGEPIYTDKSRTTVTNPVMIAEVLSPSTQNYDQGDKFADYRSIEGIKEYILIKEQQCHLMQYTKTEAGKWLLTEYENPEAHVQLASVDLEVRLNEIYC